MKQPRDHLLPRPPRIILDVTAARRAFQQLEDSMRRVALTFHRAHVATMQRALLARRKVYGGMATDARRWPDRWQSTICAGLLCSITPCPSDEHGLGCTCTCHERTRR